MKFTYLIIGNSYISINLANKFKSLKMDYIKVKNPFDLKKLKLNKQKKYIVIYLYIRRSKNVIYNKGKLSFTLNFLKKFNHEIIYISTSEFYPKTKNVRIHLNNEKTLIGKKAYILRICQIYGGKLIKKDNEYGINGFLESLKNHNLIKLNRDYENLRTYCSFDELIKSLIYLTNKKYGIKYTLLNKRKISFIYLAKKIIEYSKRKYSSILVYQEKKSQYKKNINYGKVKKIFINYNFEKNLSKVVKNYFNLS